MNKKLRMAEMARQRSAVLQEDTRKSDGVEGTIVFLAGRAGWVSSYQ